MVVCVGMGSGMGVTRFPGEPDTPDQSYWCELICCANIHSKYADCWASDRRHNVSLPVDMQVHADHQVPSPSSR